MLQQQQAVMRDNQKARIVCDRLLTHMHRILCSTVTWVVTHMLCMACCRPIDTSVINQDAWRRAQALQVGSDTYVVEVNAPYIEKVRLHRSRTAAVLCSVCMNVIVHRLSAASSYECCRLCCSVSCLGTSCTHPHTVMVQTSALSGCTSQP